MKKAKIVLKVLVLTVILVGLILTFTIGLNYGLRFQKSQAVSLQIVDGYDINELREIAREVFGNQRVMLQEVEIYNDRVIFTTSAISEEQKIELVNRVNEKYFSEVEEIDIVEENETDEADVEETDVNDETVAAVNPNAIDPNNITILDIPATRGKDIVQPYILPLVLATALVTIYFAIKYRKLNSLKVITRTIGTIVIHMAFFLGFYAVTRIPVEIYTIGLALAWYMLSVLVCIAIFEKELKGKSLN